MFILLICVCMCCVCVLSVCVLSVCVCVCCVCVCVCCVCVCAHIVSVIFYTCSSAELIEVRNIYGVHRPVEDGNFTHQLNNKQLLFHSSSVSNYSLILHYNIVLSC